MKRIKKKTQKLSLWIRKLNSLTTRRSREDRNLERSLKRKIEDAKLRWFSSSVAKNFSKSWDWWKPLGR